MKQNVERDVASKVRGTARHARAAPKRTWPPDRRPLAAMGVATVLAASVLVMVVADGEKPQATVVIPPEVPRSPDPPSATPAPPSQSAVPDDAAPSGPVVELTSPANGARLAEDRDFVAAGTVRGLGEDDLRVFIYAERRRTFYLADYRAEDVGGDGPWTIRSAGIGRPWGSEGDTYLVQAVTADRSCRGRLRGLKTGDDRYPAFPSLPDGCRVRAQVRVIER